MQTSADCIQEVKCLHMALSICLHVGISGLPVHILPQACLVHTLHVCHLVACSNFQKLSPNVKKRLAVENDDKPNQWSITDLLPLHDRIGAPCLCFFLQQRMASTCWCRFCESEWTLTFLICIQCINGSGSDCMFHVLLLAHSSGLQSKCQACCLQVTATCVDQEDISSLSVQVFPSPLIFTTIGSAREG